MKAGDLRIMGYATVVKVNRIINCGNKDKHYINVDIFPQVHETSSLRVCI